MPVLHSKITGTATNRAFSLIELMVAISIIGLLIGASAVSLTAARRNSRDTQRVSDLLSLNNAASTFLSTNGLPLAYQLMPAGGEGICKDGGVVTDMWGIASYLPAKVNKKIPTDPLSATDTSYNYRMYLNISHNPPTGGSRTITRAGSPVITLKLNYMFSAKLENTEPPRDSDIKLGTYYNPVPGSNPWDDYWKDKVILPGSYCGSTCPNAITGGDNDTTGAPCVDPGMPTYPDI